MKKLMLLVFGIILFAAFNLHTSRDYNELIGYDIIDQSQIALAEEPDGDDCWTAFIYDPNALTLKCMPDPCPYINSKPQFPTPNGKCNHIVPEE